MSTPGPAPRGHYSGSPYPYLPQPQFAPVGVPEAAGEGRLVFAAMADGLFALALAFALTSGGFGFEPRELAFAPVFLGCALCTSFVNHVIGTLLFRGSLAKQLFGLRVVRAKDGRRPGYWRTVARWLAGFVLFMVQVMLEDGGGVGQACGLRTVRRRDEHRVRL